MSTLAVVFYFGLAFVVHPVVNQSHVLQAFADLARATGGLVLPVLVVGVVWLLVVSLLIFGMCRLRPSDVGWHPHAILPALLVTLTCWIALEGILAVIVTFGDGQLTWHPAWRQPALIVGKLVGRLPGNVIGEETFFRGFLLTQLYVQASRHCRSGVALIIATVGSAIFFSLSHITSDLYERGLDGPKLSSLQLVYFINGTLLAALYLVTRNLFICVGMHLLNNEPTLLMQASEGLAKDVWWALMLILLVAWPLARRFWPWRRAPIAKDDAA